MQQPQTPPPNQPFMVQVQREESPKHALGDIIIGSFGLTGALVLGALLAGAVLAGLWIVWRRARRTFDTDAPPTIGPVAIAPKRDDRDLNG